MIQQQTNKALKIDSSQLHKEESSAAISKVVLKATSSYNTPKASFTTDAFGTLQREVGIPIVHYHNNMLLVFCFAMFLLFTVIRFSFKNYMFLTVRAAVNIQIANALFLKKNLRNLRGSFFLNVFTFLNISLFFLESYHFFSPDRFIHQQLLTYLEILAALVVIYLLKVFVILFLGFIFDGTNEAKEYISTVFIYNKNIAIFLLPITLSVPFVIYDSKPFLLYLGFLLMVYFFVYRLFRGVKILFNKHLSIFYMILYICALEILPLLVILKFLKSLA